MSLQTNAWEATLLSRARHALHREPAPASVKADHEGLQPAICACEEITRQNSRTFYLASSLLPREKRQAVRVLYAFCRVSDDLVDEGGEERLEAIQRWHRLNLDGHPGADQPVPLAWAYVRERYGIPRGCVEQLLSGVSRDLVQTRYTTFDDLAAYAYGVASTVGIMAMQIIGYESDEALPYALKLGVALQLTNILRDVREDWQAGRLYLPLEELDAYGLAEDDIAARRLGPRWAAFMRFQVERNRRLYDEAMPGIAMLHPEGRFAITAAAGLYRAILDEIERNGYDVFSRRARVSTLKKLRHLPSMWRQSRGGNGTKPRA